MLGQARRRGICQGCRYDLQVLFERGFCTSTLTSNPRPAPAYSQLRREPHARQFSHRARYLASSESNRSESLREEAQDDGVEDDALLAAQVAAIEQLEKELGKPIEQAIQEDEIPIESLMKYRDLFQSLQPRQPKSDPVTDIRNEGGSTEDVVRMARQTYGDVLPEGHLDQEELLLYTRLYGEPLEAVDEEDIGNEHVLDQEAGSENQLYSADGEEIEVNNLTISEDKDVAVTSKDLLGMDIAHARATGMAMSLGGDMIEDEDYEDVDGDDESTGIDRGHPLTVMGKFRTNPKTIFLSQDGFVRPVEKIMSGYSNKHLREVCERTFGGPGLPDSPLTPRSGRSRQQIPIPLDVSQNTMSEMEANAFVSAVMPPTYACVTSALVETHRRLGATWLNDLLAREGGPRVLDAGAGGAAIIAWREIVQAHWDTLHSSDKTPPLPPATKSVVLTGSDGLRHRAAGMLENTTFVPRLPDYTHTRDVPTLEDDRPTQQRKKFDVIIASHTLLGQKEDWMRKQYVQNLWSMLSREKGILILIEKGVPRGFEAIAGAREMILDRYLAVPEGQSTHYSKNQAQQLDDDTIHKKETGMIVAPCTNHERCPMYTAPGLSRGRKDICSFQQRYIRPPFLQRVLGAKDRNHDDVDFSYLSVMKGDDLRTRNITSWDQLSDPLSAPRYTAAEESSISSKALIAEAREGFEHVMPHEDVNTSGVAPASTDPLPTLNQVPRIVYSPLKRRGHVSIDLCTPTGQIERWTIPRSFSKQAYRDARKSRWGDLWALGAKTQIARNLQLGTPEKDLFGKDGEVIRGRGRGRKERLKIKAMEMLEKHEEQKMDDLMEQRDLMAALDEELGADPGLPREAGPQAAPTPAKPMNNRERKAAKRAMREGKSPVSETSQLASNTADLTFRPQPRPRAPQSTHSVADDLAEQHALSEWQTEFEDDTALSKGQSRSVLKGFRGSKAAKEMQRYKISQRA